MKAMATLMRAGKTFSEAHATASKKSVTQKQKQSQQVVINLAAPRRRRRAAPRQSARPNSARVLISMNTRLVVPDASFNRIGPIDGSLVVVGDLSVNGNVKFSGDIFANNLNGTLQKNTIFDDISCTTTNGIWRDIPQSRDFAAGKVLIHINFEKFYLYKII